MPGPDFSHESALKVTPVCGVDEAGRGPWAGPVVAAAVILDPGATPEGLNDSKKLPAHRREALYAQLMARAVCGVGSASVAEIDRLNILRATHLAMCRAALALPVAPVHALIDGNRCPEDLRCPATPVVRGDSLSLSIAAASIVAKVTRDRMMVALAQQYPGYGWERNAGYGVPEHRRGLESLGVSPHHRRSFKPIHNMLYPE